MTRISEWTLGIVGAIAAFMGALILLAGEDQYVGLGGSLTWRIGDIAAGWSYGLLAAGIALLLGSLAIALWARRHPRSHEASSERAGVITHIIVFVVVNGFLWIQDAVSGGGLEYAQWTTIPWGIGLVTHIVAYLSRGRRDKTTLRPAM